MRRGSDDWGIDGHKEPSVKNMLTSTLDDSNDGVGHVLGEAVAQRGYKRTRQRKD